MDMDSELKDLYQTGRENFQKGIYAKAQECLEEFIEKNQSFPDVYNMLGIIYHTQGDYDEAVKHFERALDLNPKYTETALNLAVTYTDLGQYAKARGVYERISKAKRMDSLAKLQDDFARSKIANMHMELGEVYRSIGLYDEAIEEYRKALKLKPQFVDIKTKLGMALRDKGFVGQAVREFEEAKRVNPGYAPAGIQLGIAHYSMGKVDEALAEWEDVLRRNPGNPVAEMYIRLAKKKDEK